MKNLYLTLKEYTAYVVIGIVLAWVFFALAFQITMIGLEVTGKTETIKQITDWFYTKFDGNFKNHPNNINYVAEDHIWVDNVVNNVKVGKLAGNRQLAFGVKNILEEYLQDKGYDITPNAPYKLQVQIIYLDVLTTKKNISVFHKNEEEVVIRLKGILYKDGKKEKEVIVEESSSEISMSTLIVDEGGQFNQTSLSNALKKGCDKLITKLFDK